MTTGVTTTFLDHTSDAGFRAWVAEIISMLTTAGIVQTSDTGQIDTATVLRPGASANAGYAIFRMADTMQATAPVFFRIDFGTNAATTRPRMLLTVGTGTNGSGTITGLGMASAEITNTGAPGSPSTNYTTRVCVVDGFVGMMWKLGAGGTGCFAFFAIMRSVDSTGAATADAASIYRGVQSPNVVMVRYAGANSSAMVVGSYSLIVGGYSASLVSGSAQVFKHYQALPRVIPCLHLLTVISSELGNNTTFTATPVGSTSHTYVSGGAEGIQSVGLPSATAFVMAMIWE